MKKIIPFIAPIVFGLFGGLFVECIMIVLSIMTSPFANHEESTFLFFAFFISIISAILAIAIMIVNVVYLINLDNKNKTKKIIIVQICIGIVLLFLFWTLWGNISNELHFLIRYDIIKRDIYNYR